MKNVMKDTKATMFAIMPKTIGSAASAPLVAAPMILVSDLNNIHEPPRDDRCVRTNEQAARGRLRHLRFLELHVLELGLALLGLRVKELGVAQRRGRGHHGGGDQIDRLRAERDVSGQYRACNRRVDRIMSVRIWRHENESRSWETRDRPETVENPEHIMACNSEDVSLFRYCLTSRGDSDWKVKNFILRKRERIIPIWWLERYYHADERVGDGDYRLTQGRAHHCLQKPS